MRVLARLLELIGNLSKKVTYRDVGEGHEQGCGSFAYMDVGEGREQGCGSFAYRDAAKECEHMYRKYGSRTMQEQLSRMRKLRTHSRIPAYVAERTGLGVFGQPQGEAQGCDVTIPFRDKL